MKVLVGQYYRWTRGRLSFDDYYHMVVRIEQVLSTSAEYIVVEHAPDFSPPANSYPIGYKSSITLVYGELPANTGWELLDDFEYWVKECRGEHNGVY